MIKRIRRALELCRTLKLCRELRSENKGLKNSLEEAWNEVKQRNSMITFLEERLREKASIDVPYSTVSFIIPNLYYLEATMGPIMGSSHLDSRPQAEYMTGELTNEMKIKLFNDLFEQGYIRKTGDNKDREVYEIKVVR